MASSADDDIWLWALDSRKRVAGLGGDNHHVLKVAFSSSGNLLGIATTVAVHLWTVRRQQKAAKPLSMSSGLEVINNVAFSPDLKLLAAANEDGTLTLWDVVKRRRLGTLRQGKGALVTSLALGVSLLASGADDGSIRLWDMPTLQPLGIILQGPGDVVTTLAFSADEKLLAAAGNNGAIQLWDLDRNSQVAWLCRWANRNLSRREWQQYVGSSIPYHRTCPNLPGDER